MKTNLRKIGLIGCGRGGKRFLEACMFFDDVVVNILGFDITNKARSIAEKEKLKYFNFNYISESTLSNFDILIISIPVCARYEVLKKLKLFNGKIIFDKPFADNTSGADKLMSCLKDNQWFTFYTRDFLQQKNFTVLKINDIKVPITQIENDVDPVKVLIPHILNLIINRMGIHESIVVRKDKKVFLNYDGYIFIFCFDQTLKNVNGILFNNTLLPWPAYLSSYYKMLEYALKAENFSDLFETRKNKDKKIAEIMTFL